MKEKETATPVAEEQLPGPPKSIIREYFESGVVTIIMALFGMTFVLQAVKVPTGSMQNTIEIGDHLLVNKFVFGGGAPFLPFLPQRQIKRGDIVVFKYPGNQFDPNDEFDSNPTNIPLKTNYVKRVIGMPGEMLEFRGTTVYIDGKPLPEQVLEGNSGLAGAPLSTPNIPPRKPDEKYSVYYSEATLKMSPQTRMNSGFHFGVGKPVKIPDNSYFVMGDSRDNSQDSRFWGFVPRDYIFGRAMFIYWSYDESNSEGNFLNTRWGRTGTMIK